MSSTTVLIPTSPIPYHPSTAIIDEVILSIRKQLPESNIILLCDGVRPEVEHRRKQYEEYVGRLICLYERNFKVEVVHFAKHRQQAGMLKDVLPTIKTRNIFFCEHDAVISDKKIPWELFESLLYHGAANTIRLYWHHEIHPEHVHLMGERDGNFVKTTQWSSWPHISRTDFFHQTIEQYFPDGQDCKMVETVLYSPVVESPWEVFKTVIYAPEPDAIRFHHLNARVDPTTGEKDPGSW